MTTDVVRARLPFSWSSPSPKKKVAKLPAGSRVITLALLKSRGEKAGALLRSKNGLITLLNVHAGGHFDRAGGINGDVVVSINGDAAPEDAEEAAYIIMSAQGAVDVVIARGADAAAERMANMTLAPVMF